MTTPSQQTITLIRGLTLIAAVSIIIGNVIGTGVFLKARVMTCNVGTPGMVITVWVVAGLLSLAGALTYAELAAMMPRAGGEYVFVREAYGSGASFLYGWMQIFIAKTGSQASVAVAFAIFLNDLTGGALGAVYFTPNLFGYDFPIGTPQLIAIGLIALITLLNCAAVVVSGWVATALTCVKIALVLGIGVGAFVLAQGDWGHYAMANAGGACEGVDPGGAARRGGLRGGDARRAVGLRRLEQPDARRGRGEEPAAQHPARARRRHDHDHHPLRLRQPRLLLRARPDGGRQRLAKHPRWRARSRSSSSAPPPSR